MFVKTVFDFYGGSKILWSEPNFHTNILLKISVAKQRPANRCCSESGYRLQSDECGIKAQVKIILKDAASQEDFMSCIKKKEAQM